MEDKWDSWYEEAVCRGDDPAKWFPEERNPIHTTAFKEEVEELRAICATCPVARQCLEQAMAHSTSIENGVFAGTTGAQRKKLLKEILDTEEDYE